MHTTVLLDGSVYAYHQQVLYVDRIEVNYDRMLVDSTYIPSVLPYLSDTGRIVLFLLPLVDPGIYALVTVYDRVYDMATYLSVPTEDVATILPFIQLFRQTFTQPKVL